MLINVRRAFDTVSIRELNDPNNRNIIVQGKICIKKGKYTHLHFVVTVHTYIYIYILYVYDIVREY